MKLFEIKYVREEADIGRYFALGRTDSIFLGLLAWPGPWKTHSRHITKSTQIPIRNKLILTFFNR
jgi:hypothetical protein